MDDTRRDIHAPIDAFCAGIRTRRETLTDELWGSGGFLLVGSEAGEVYRTRPDLAAKFAAIFSRPATLRLAFPDRSVTVSGAVAWVFLEGTLSRIHPDGRIEPTVYLASCVFKREDGVWRWRQFFGSEPS